MAIKTETATVYRGGGFDFFETLEEAEKAFKESIKHWEDAATEDGEWMDEAIQDLCMGTATHRCKLVSANDPEYPNAANLEIVEFSP